MSAETQLADGIVAAQPARGRHRWLRRLRARFAWRFLTARFSSSLTRRIVVLNLGGLVVLVIGFLLLNQFRADIIAAREQSLTTQADIIAAAIAASATVDTDSITVDPDKLLQLGPGRERGAVAERRGRNPVLHQPGAGRAVPASTGHADPHARAHLRQRRPASARFALAFGARRGRALRSARATEHRGLVDRIVGRRAQLLRHAARAAATTIPG